MLKSLYLYLLALLSPHADDDLPPDDDTPPDDDLPSEDDTPPDDDLPPDDDTPPDEPPVRETRAQREIRTLRERAQQAEAARQAAEAQLEAARRQPQQPSQPTEADQLWQQEEAILRDPNAEPWQRYAVESNRRARAAEANSQNALRQAEDMADRTRFEQLKLTKPKLFEKYAARVETELAKHRANGVNPPREGLLKLLLGEDMLNGTAKTADTKPKGGAPRERTPGARSDVNSSGSGMSEAEKRAKRLENVRI